MNEETKEVVNRLLKDDSPQDLLGEYDEELVSKGVANATVVREIIRRLTSGETPDDFDSEYREEHISLAVHRHATDNYTTYSKEEVDEVADRVGDGDLIPDLIDEYGEDLTSRGVARRVRRQR